MNQDELKEIRQKMGLSNLELSKKLFKHRRTVERYQTGDLRIPEATQKIIESLYSEYCQNNA